MHPRPASQVLRLTGLQWAQTSRRQRELRLKNISGRLEWHEFPRFKSAATRSRRCGSKRWSGQSLAQNLTSKTRYGISGAFAPQMMLAPIHGLTWGYRHRARLTVRHVAKKGGVLVGFHERKSSYVADMTSCSILPERISALLPELRVLIGRLTIRDRVPQIELAIGDDAQGSIDALVLRILAPLAPVDESELAAFADRHGIEWYLQPQGPDTVQAMRPARALTYTLPEFDVAIEFGPTDFTQVNAALNRVLVRRAIGLLDPQPGERIADFFCGLGNFTLPIARRGAQVDRRRGQQAARAPRAKPTRCATVSRSRHEFAVADLFKATPESVAAFGPLDKALLDPPRDGAIALVKALPETHPAHRLRLLQPRHARPRRGRAGDRARLHAARGRHREHVPAHRARRVDRAVRARGRVRG